MFHVGFHCHMKKNLLYSFVEYMIEQESYELANERKEKELIFFERNSSSLMSIAKDSNRLTI